MADMRRATSVREPLYSMEEFSEKLGISHRAVSAISKTYGAPKPEFDGGISSVTRKSRYRMSVVREWWNSIPNETRERMVKRAAERRAGAQ